MKGIPVLPNGDPVTRTFVRAGNYHQFMNWCHYSQVNPYSRLIKYVSHPESLRGYRDYDLVYTGTWSNSKEPGWYHVLRWARDTDAILRTYDQYEIADIEANVIEVYDDDLIEQLRNHANR